MNYATLLNEVQADPQALGYAGKTDEQVAGLLNAKTQTRPRGVIPAHEIIEATVAAEFGALSAAEKQRYEILVSAGQVNVQGANTRAALAAMFASGTTTRSNLVALQTETVSRAEVLGLGPVAVGHIAKARAFGG